MSTTKQAQVIYYLCREATMEHPHSIDVGYVESNGLLLKDVKRRLISIRGKKMPNMFAWSYKRNYKDDFIWHDVSDNDMILPTNDAEYILKGSELVNPDSVPEQCPSRSSSEADIQYKNILRDNTAKLREAEYNSANSTTRNSKELCKPKSVSEQRQMHEDIKFFKDRTQPSFSCRGDKPLPDKKKLGPVHLPILEVAETGNIDSPRTTRKGPALKQIFPCRDIHVEEKKLIRPGFTSVKQDLSVFSSCSVSWKNIGDKLGPLNFAGNSTTGSSDYKQTTPVKLRQKNSVTRYRPRNSFSNSEYFDGYDMYLRPEMSRQSNARSSTESWQAYYEYDKEVSSKQSPNESVSSHIISKLVQANESEKDKALWWDEVPTPEQVNEDPSSRKNKLDWEKNLQEAVNMIINPV